MDPSTMILDNQPYLVSLILQAFLYIPYLASLVHVLRWLLYEDPWILKRRDNVNWSQLTITLIVFLFTTVDLALDIAVQLLFRNGWLITKQQITITSISIESTTLLITDAILIIRCWLVYQMSWRVVCFPLILWLANIICVINWITNYTLWVFVSEVPYHQRMTLVLRLYYCCNFVTNLYTTSAIFYRLWRVARANRNRQSSILYRICRIVATTGILYTCTSLPQVVTAFYIRQHLGVYILCDAINFSIAGITFNLFLIRAGQLRSQLSGMVLDRSTRASESIWLTTVPFGVSVLATNDTQADPNLRENKDDEDRKRDPT